MMLVTMPVRAETRKTSPQPPSGLVATAIEDSPGAVGVEQAVDTVLPNGVAGLQ